MQYFFSKLLIYTLNNLILLYVFLCTIVYFWVFLDKTLIENNRNKSSVVDKAAGQACGVKKMSFQMTPGHHYNHY